VTTVTVSRHVDAPPAAVREAMADLAAFTRAAGFDAVRVEGDRIEVAKGVGPVRLELTLAVVEDPDAVLAYVQAAGVFERLEARYEVAPVDGGSSVTATTEFELGPAVVGPVLDATVVARQRRAELEAQFDHLASECA
jgi:carbon monoxide dehydrogenase subunit G